MNTTPADEILALWVEDELHGPERAKVDAWALSEPEWLSHREAARQSKSLLRSVLPAAEEPPYAEFFNARIAREISAAAVEAPQRGAQTPSRTGWLTWFMPTAAAAGMALCFWAGTHVPTGSGEGHHSLAQNNAPEPFLYTPESGVKAAWYGSSDSGSSVIVLDGVAAIPDSFEIPDTASIEETPSTTADLDQ